MAQGHLTVAKLKETLAILEADDHWEGFQWVPSESLPMFGGLPPSPPNPPPLLPGLHKWALGQQPKTFSMDWNKVEAKLWGATSEEEFWKGIANVSNSQT